MPIGRVFVMTYSLVLVGLFASFAYLMTTIDPPKKLQPLNDTHVSSTVTTTVFQTSPTSETIIALKTAATKTTTNSKTTTTETTDKNKRAGGRIAAQVNIRGHRRKENFKDELTKTIPELPSTTQSTVLRYMISPMPYDVTYTNTGISEKPIEHTLMELGDKIQRILPPVHPAVKGFRRSVDDAGYGLTDKNVILLKVVCDEDEPRIEIKLATNGYSKQPKSSKIKLSKKTEIEKLKYYVQFHNKSVLDDLLVEPSYSSNDIDYYYQASKMSASIFKENGYVRNEATIKINGSPLNELHKSLLTTDSDASTISYSLPTYTTQHKSNIDSTGLVNNVTMLANEETDAIETVNTKDFYTHHNNLTQNGNISEITTPPEVLNVDKFLQNVDSYRKIYSQSFYQRDKSDLARGVSQVTSDFLLHFLPLVVPHALPRSANLMSFSNGSNNDDFKTNKGENKKILKSSPILGKIMTDLNINVKTRLLHSDHELNNNNTINHHKISNITDESDITGDFENTTVDSTTTIDGFKMIFLRKDLRETLVRSSTPNMTIVKVTPIETNVNKPKTWSFSNNNEIKYNLTPTTSTFRVKKEVNVNVNVEFPKGNNSSFLSQKHKINVEGTTKIIERQRKNFNLFKNKISTPFVSNFIQGTALTTNDMRTSWLENKSKENKTFRKLGRHFHETHALKPVVTIAYINTITISDNLSPTNSSETEIYPIL